MYSAIEDLADEIEEGVTEFKNIHPLRQPMVYLILEDRLSEDELADIKQDSELEETHGEESPMQEDALKQATAYELARLYMDLDGATEKYDFKEEYWKLIRGAATAGIYNRIKPLVNEGIDDLKTNHLAGRIYSEENFLEELGADLNNGLAEIDSTVVQNWLDRDSSESSNVEQPDDLSMVVFFIRQIRFFLNQEDLLDNSG